MKRFSMRVSKPVRIVVWLCVLGIITLFVVAAVQAIQFNERMMTMMSGDDAKQ